MSFSQKGANNSQIGHQSGDHHGTGYPFPVKQGLAQENQTRVGVKRDPFHAYGDVSEPGEIHIAAQIIAKKSQSDHPGPVLFGQGEGLLATVPPPHEDENGKGKSHPQSEHADGIRIPAIGQLDKNPLGAKEDRTRSHDQERGQGISGWIGRSWRRRLHRDKKRPTLEERAGV